MFGLFSGCSSLTHLKGLSKWNTINVISMSRMFENCKSLINLNDISEWNIISLTDINFIIIAFGYTIN